MARCECPIATRRGASGLQQRGWQRCDVSGLLWYGVVLEACGYSTWEIATFRALGMGMKGMANFF
jgi:hypothetical protein